MLGSPVIPGSRLWKSIKRVPRPILTTVIIDWNTQHHTNLISFVAETDKLAIQVNFIYCDAPTGWGVLANARFCHSGAHHAWGLTVIIIETALLAARWITTAGGGGVREQQAAWVTVPWGRGRGSCYCNLGRRAWRQTQPEMRRRKDKSVAFNASLSQRLHFPIQWFNSSDQDLIFTLLEPSTIATQSGFLSQIYKPIPLYIINRQLSLEDG